MKNLIILLFFVNFIGLLAQPVYQLDNLNFEKGIVGGDPFPWRFPQTVKKFGYSGYLTDTVAFSGRFSFKMNNPNNNPEQLVEGDPNECTVYMNVEPTYYLNKRIRFSIFAKLETILKDTRVEMWVIAKDKNNKVSLSYFDTINIVAKDDWKQFSIETKIPNAASELRFGLLMIGGGTLYLDKANFEIINDDNYKPLVVKSLNPDNLSNINSLAKIFASMKYFLPSDKSNKTNWDAYLEQYLSQNLQNSQNKEFLENFIKPYKESVFISDKNSNSSPKLDNLTLNQITYAMLYKGVPNPMMNENGDNFRKNIYASTRRREGSITIMADLIKYSGKELRISADIRVNKESPGANAQLWARADIVNSKEIVSKTTANDPVFNNEWEKRIIYIDLPENVYRVKLALVFLGEGSANFDNIKMEIYDKGKVLAKIDNYNFDFEQTSNLNQIKDWEIDDAVIGAGYSFEIDYSSKTNGKNSLRIKSDNNRVVYPEQGTYLSFDLNNSKNFNINVCSFTQNGKSLPIENNEAIINEPDSIFRNWEDASARISALIQIYSLIINFGANEFSQAELDSAFQYSLSKLIESIKYDECLKIYNNFLLVAKDSRARIWNSFVTYDYGLPILFKQVENKFIVNKIFDEKLKSISVGNEIISINDKPINEYLNSLSNDFYSSNSTFKLSKAGAMVRAGEQNSELKFTFKTTNDTLSSVNIKRSNLLNEIFESRPDPIYQYNDSVLYIDMTEIGDDYMKEILNRLESFKYFIFDLRGESLMSEHLLSLFSDTIISSYNWVIPFYTHPFKRNITRETLLGLIKPKNKFKDKKLYFLINERSGGYSDFIARIIKKNKFGILVGNETQGNPSELTSTKLSGGFSLTLSSILLVDDNNKVILDNPVQPDIKVEESIKEIIEGKDAYIEKVLEEISSNRKK